MRLIGQICNRLQRASGRFGFGTASVRQLGAKRVRDRGETGGEKERTLEKEREGMVESRERERERTLRIGKGEEAGGTGREIAWKRDKREKDRERDDRTRGTDVFETSCAALAMPKFISTSSPFSATSGLSPSLVHFAPTIVRLVIRANLIARRHRWPLTGIELSAVSLPAYKDRRLLSAYCAKEALR